MSTPEIEYSLGENKEQVLQEICEKRCLGQVDEEESDTKKPRVSDGKKMYLLLYIMPYHGGSRGSELGIFESRELAEIAWRHFVENCMDPSEIRPEKEKWGGGVFGPQVLEFELNREPEEFWAGKHVSYCMSPQ